MSRTTTTAKVQLAFWMLVERLTARRRQPSSDLRSHAQDGGGWEDSWYGDLRGFDDDDAQGSPVPKRPAPGSGSASATMAEPNIGNEAK